jgi:hypothetical protein
MSILRMLPLKFGHQERNAWSHIPAIIICKVNNRISKTSAFVADILYIMLKLKNKNIQAFIWIKSRHVHICLDTWYYSVDNLGNLDTLLDEPQI